MQASCDIVMATARPSFLQSALFTRGLCGEAPGSDARRFQNPRRPHQKACPAARRITRAYPSHRATLPAPSTPNPATPNAKDTSSAHSIQSAEPNQANGQQAEPIPGSEAAPSKEGIDSPGRAASVSGKNGLPACQAERNPSRRQVLSTVLTAAGGSCILDQAPSTADAASLFPTPPSDTFPSSWLGNTVSECSISGVSALRDPVLNRGLTLTAAQRQSLGIEGLLPPVFEELGTEIERALWNLEQCTTDLQKYQYLVTLKETNEACFYALLMERTQELLPIVYTPTVGDACLNFGTLSPRPMGLYVSVADRAPERMMQNVSSWPEDDIRIVVITDGERILGLGDLGVYGMGIPVGKCMVYTACGGVSPRQLLPITVDAGTNNEALRSSPFYLGQRTERVRGEEYDDVMDSLIDALRRRYGGSVVIHWEDLGAGNSWRLLERYSARQVCTFNDDIQATAAVVLAGLLSALRITGGRLRDQRVLFFGAGQASIGTADQIIYALTREGVPEADARAICWQFDSRGLIYRGRSSLTDRKAAFAHPLRENTFDPTSLPSTIEALRPTILIGAAGVKGAFDEKVLKSMAAVTDRPIIFALSNPVSKSECTPWEAVFETKGRAVFASGSPFKPIVYDNQTMTTGFANNAFIFPGVGLGTISSGATAVTDEMMYSAAIALAECVTEADLSAGSVYPSASGIRDTALTVAAAVAASAASEMVASSVKSAQLCSAAQGRDAAAWRQCIEGQRYQPQSADQTR